MKYVAYYRVSTKEQENSHLSLEAQQKTVLDYIKNNGNQVIAEFTEVESGRNNKRPELLKSIALTKKEQATLVIARLDRLSRSVTLVSTLKDTGVEFVCCDTPFADKTSIIIIAAIAQREAELISIRTKEALQAKFRREPEYRSRHGRKADGSINLTEQGRAKGHATLMRKARTDVDIRKAWHFIEPRREKGMSYREIARQLNEEGYLTRRGLPFTAVQVFNINKRFKTL